MTPKNPKIKPKAKGKNLVDDGASTHSIEQLSQSSQKSQRSRAKKYTKEECDMLAKVCVEYRQIIDKNSNKDIDVKSKKMAWEKIKRSFDTRCRVEAIYVSCFVCDSNIHIVCTFIYISMNI